MSSRPRRILTERAMQMAERRFPELAARSGHEAYKATLSITGGVVVKTSQGQMVERRSDGTSTVLKSLSVGKRIKPGIVLKRAK
jgi:hypothetical protein